LSKVRDIPPSRFNFQIQGDNPGKIVSIRFNGTATIPPDFIHPIVVDCIERTNVSKYALNGFLTYDIISSFATCISNTFEPKVNESGWRCAAGIDNMFAANPNNKYHAIFFYNPLTVGLYL